MIEQLLILAGKYTPPLPKGDLSNHDWVTVPGALSLFHNVGASYNGHVYSTGGFNVTAATYFNRYDKNGNSLGLAPMPVPRAGHSVAVVGEHMYLFGGLGVVNNVFIDTTGRYNFRTGAWDTRAPSPTVTAWGDCCVIGTDIYLMGGTTSYPSTESPTRFVSYKYDTIADKWTDLSIADIPPRIVNGCCSVGLDIYVLGGRFGGAYKNDFYKYDTITKQVTRLANLPASMGSRHTLFGLGNTVVSLAGQLVGDAAYQATQQYQIETNTWAVVENSPLLRAYAAAGQIDDQFYLISGTVGSTLINNTAIFRKP